MINATIRVLYQYLPPQHPVSFCSVSKMSLASIMKTVFICLEVREEILFASGSIVC